MTSLTPLASLHLQDKHRIAMQQAMDWLGSVAQPLGVVASGSIVRGTPGPASDLDVVVLHAGQGRRRIQRWFNGTPVELFFNSGQWLRHCMREEAAQGRPVMAHMLATGTIILDTDEQMAGLVSVARAILDQGPNLGADALTRDRYAAACQVEDALDLGAADTPDARHLLGLAVGAVARHAYLRQNRFLPRPKERLALLAALDPVLARLLSLALSEPPSEALRSLTQASERVLGSAGFFEWDSGWDGSAPASGMS